MVVVVVAVAVGVEVDVAVGVVVAVVVAVAVGVAVEMMLVKCEVYLGDHQDDGTVRWPVYAFERNLRIERVDYDSDQFIGALYYRTRKIIEPDYDLDTGKCIWRGNRHEVILVRQTQNRSIEIPDDCGALVGWFPDRWRGRWLVFSPAQQKHTAGHIAPHPQTNLGTEKDQNGHGSRKPEPAVPTPASSVQVSTELTDNDWLKD